MKRLSCWASRGHSPTSSSPDELPALRLGRRAQDDEGLGWTTLDDAADPDVVRPGAYLLAGNRHGQAVVRIVAVDDDGQVHFSILPAPVAKNRHLLGRTVA
jgi:hypothetical protein